MFKRAAALKVLIVPLLVVLCVAGGATLYWFLYAKGRAAYLTSRNLRVLETLSGYIERSLDGDVSTLDSFMRVPVDRRKATVARTVIPLIGLLEGSERYAALPPEQVTDFARFYLSEPLSGTDWTITRRRPLVGSKLEFRVRIERVLDPILRDQLTNDVFDDVVLATTDGRVLFQRQPASLRIQSLASVSIDTGDKSAGKKFSELSHATAVGTTTVAGTRYQLFIQPCCGSIRAMDKSSRGWVLVGLTPAARNSYRSLALSFTLLAPLIVLTTGAFLAWPFLKIVLLGRFESVRVLDAATVIASGVLAVALLTIVLLDVYAVRGLGRRLDHQLEVLSAKLIDNFNTEIARAAIELNELEGRAAVSPQLPRWFADGARSEPASADGFVYILEEQPAARYPLFETFAVAYDDGHQAMKWTSAAFLTPLVDVTEREYYAHWKGNGKTARDGVFVQSIRSMTTGRKQAVLSKPVGHELRVKAFDTYPKERKIPTLFVSMLTMPMASLVDTVVAGGFGYAVIDEDGTVLFHSDPRHNLEEQFFLETDHNRPLRAAVAARQPDYVDFTYWGGEYRGRVTPLQGENIAADESGYLPWTLVTFYDKAVFRGLHLEWLLTALILVVMAVIAYLGLAVVTRVVGRRYIAPWLWPDRRNYRAYLRLSCAAFAWTLAACAAIAFLSGASALLVVALLPLFAWTLCYVLLSSGDPSTIRMRIAASVSAAALVLTLALALQAERTPWAIAVALPLLAGGAIAIWTSRHTKEDRREETLAWTALRRPFAAWAVLMLTLTAMMPAVAAFKVAATIQVDAFVKSRQLRLARDVQAHRMRIDKAAELARATNAAPFYEAAVVGDYVSAFLDTATAAPERNACPLPVDAGRYHASLMGAIEQLLPYFSESSVELRKLIRDEAADGRAWNWDRPCAGRLALNLSQQSDAAPIRLDSNVALMTAWPVTATPEQWSLLLLLLAVPLGLAFAIARFIMLRIFIIDLNAPNAPSVADSSRPEVSVFGFLWHGAAAQRRWKMGRALGADPVTAIPAATAVADSWDSVLDEATQRATPDYQAAWQQCSPDQKVALEHLATHGVANEKGRRELAQLMAKGLVRRAPNFVLASEPLRRFVLSEECRSDVTRLEESQDDSVWDRIRGPLLFAIAIATGFFVFTQQEVLSEAVRVVVTVVGALPTVLNLLGSVGSKGAAPKAA